MSNCKFTIITVCYNAEAYVEDTIKSVLSQTYTGFEYIIKDGNSSDATTNIAHSLIDGDSRVRIMQGKDQGIYDAMNIAVASAEGEYILFLNAGDLLHEKTSLSDIANLMENAQSDVYYGNVVQVDVTDGIRNYAERLYSKNSIRKIQFAFGRCLCHQAMFVKRTLFTEKNFDITFHVCADREWQLYFLFFAKRSFSYLPIIVSDVLVDGYSKQHVRDLEKEVRNCIRQYCKGYLWIYDSIMFLKRNILIKKMLQRIDSLLQMRGRKDYE